MNISQYFGEFADISFDLYAIFDLNGRLISYNKRWHSLFGYVKEDLINKSYADLIYMDDRDFSLNMLSLIQKNVPVNIFINRILDKNGSFRYIEWNIKLSKNFIFAAGRDRTEIITEKKILQDFVKQTMLLLQSDIGEIDYQYLCDEMYKISHAKAVMLNIWDTEKAKFVNKAFSASPETSNVFKRLLGFDLKNSEWPLIQDREDKLNQGKLVCFDNIKSYASGIIPLTDDDAQKLENELDIKRIYIIQLFSKEEVVGHFVMAMKKGDIIHNSSIIELHANQVGMAVKRSQTEKAVYESEEKYRLFIENFLGIAYQVNIKKDRLILFQGLIESITGYKPKEFIEGSIKWFDIVHKDDFPDFDKSNKNIFSEPGVLGDNEYRIIRKDGSISWVRDIRRISPDTGVLQGSIYDINNTKEIEKAFKEKNLLLLNLLNSMPDLVSIKDLNGNYLACNPKFAEYAGRDMEKIIGLSDNDLFKKEVAELYTMYDKLVIKQGRMIQQEEWFYYPDKSNKLMHSIKVPLVNDNNSIIGVVIVSRDITDSKNIQNMLKKNTEKLRQISENMSEVFWMRSANNKKVLYINPAYENIWQKSCNSLYEDPDSFLDSILSEDRDMVLKNWESYTQGDSNFDIEFRIKRPDGAIRWIWARSNPVVNEFDIVLRHTGIAVDITDRMEDKKRLETRDKMLSAIAVSAKELIKNPDFKNALSKCFVLIGQAAGVDRVYLFQTSYNEEENIHYISQTIEYNNGSFSSQIDNPELQNIPFSSIPDFIDPLLEGRSVNMHIKDMKKELRKQFEIQEIKSILILPIFFKESFWGFIGFDECKYRRVWSKAEISLLESFVSLVINALERKEKESGLNVIEEFLNNISHGIKTPLNDIISFLQLLKSTDPTKEQMDYISRIQKSSDDLLVFLNNHQYLSIAEENKCKLNNIKNPGSRIFSSFSESTPNDPEKTEPVMKKYIMIIDDLDIINDTLRESFSKDRCRYYIFNDTNNAILKLIEYNKSDKVFDAVFIDNKYLKNESYDFLNILEDLSLKKKPSIILTSQKDQDLSHIDISKFAHIIFKPFSKNDLDNILFSLENKSANTPLKSIIESLSQDTGLSEEEAEMILDEGIRSAKTMINVINDLIQKKDLISAARTANKLKKLLLSIRMDNEARSAQTLEQTLLNGNTHQASKILGSSLSFCRFKLS